MIHGAPRNTEKDKWIIFFPLVDVMVGTKKNRLFPRSWSRANCPHFLKFHKFPREAAAILRRALEYRGQAWGCSVSITAPCAGTGLDDTKTCWLEEMDRETEGMVPPFLYLLRHIQVLLSHPETAPPSLLHLP